MSAATGTAAKTERLLNLVLVLLYTRRPLSKAQIRTLVPQYGATASTEAFDRMFERDKDELRGLGVPLATEEIDAFHEDEPGYRIHQRDYALPDIDFEPDELAVLGLASRSWAHASMAGPAAEALRKLRAAGVERDEGALIGIEPRLRTTEPAFEAVKDAVLSRTPVTFDYRRPEGSRPRPARCSPGRSSSGTAAGTSPGTTSTARTPASSGCRASTVRCARPGAPGRSRCPPTTRPGCSSSGPTLAVRPVRPASASARGRRTACAAARTPRPRPTAGGPS